jgi:hypothetical protein
VRYWLDTEFIERPCTIDLVSIGIVAEDGREFYAESIEADWSKADDWLLENVRAHLRGPEMFKADIRDGILRFIGDDKPEFWAYYADYDWVAFCWLFGRMIDLPKGFPMFCRDIKQWAVDLGNPKLPPQDGTEHHALADARWNREAWAFLRSLASREKPAQEPWQSGTYVDVGNINFPPGQDDDPQAQGDNR